jgi:hypothetical protein
VDTLTIIRSGDRQIAMIEEDRLDLNVRSIDLKTMKDYDKASAVIEEILADAADGVDDMRTIILVAQAFLSAYSDSFDCIDDQSDVVANLHRVAS